MMSYLEYRYGLDDGPRTLGRAVQLPANYNPRTLEFAQSLRRQHTVRTARQAAVPEQHQFDTAPDLGFA